MQILFLSFYVAFPLKFFFYFSFKQLNFNWTSKQIWIAIKLFFISVTSEFFFYFLNNFVKEIVEKLSFGEEKWLHWEMNIQSFFLCENLVECIIIWIIFEMHVKMKSTRKENHWRFFFFEEVLKRFFDWNSIILRKSKETTAI